MSLIPRLFLSVPSGWAAGGILIVVFLLSGFGVAWAIRDLPDIPADPAVLEPGESPVVSALETRPARSSIPLEGWAVFRMDGEAVREVAGSLADRFRLAGTFRVMQPSGLVRKAVISDQLKTNQTIVATGDFLDDGILVEAIDDRRIELVQNDVTCELTLEYAAVDGGSNRTDDAGGMAEDTRGYEVVSRGRFGLQVTEDRWLFERKKMLAYYNEVLEDADRLVALFDSLKPLYDEKRKIGGYILIPEGEKEFFREVGLKEGDVLRKVNKMPLMNRRVAEGFIRDFADNQMNVAVLDIEREGKPATLVFEFR